MDTLELTYCPEFRDSGEVCGALTEIIDRYLLGSTDGPVEHVRTRCLRGHFLACLAEDFFETDLDLYLAASENDHR